MLLLTPIPCDLSSSAFHFSTSVCKAWEDLTLHDKDRKGLKRLRQDPLTYLKPTLVPFNLKTSQVQVSKSQKGPFNALTGNRPALNLDPSGVSSAGGIGPPRTLPSLCLLISFSHQPRPPCLTLALQSQSMRLISETQKPHSLC